MAMSQARSKQEVAPPHSERSPIRSERDPALSNRQDSVETRRENGHHRQDACATGGSLDFWGRVCRLIVFLVLILIPCLYPLRLPDSLIEALRQHSRAWWYGFYVSQMDTFINYGYSPLPLKEGAFTVLVVLLFVCWYIRQIVLAGSESQPTANGFDWKLYGPIAALLVWAAISLLYTPTLYWSLTTYALMATGLIWFIVVYQMPKTAHLVRRWFNTVLLAGGVVAFFAFLQDVDRGRWITGLLFVDIERAAQSDPTILRLRMGSLIGHNIGVAGFLLFSWFILLSRLFQPVPWRCKIGWAALLVLILYVIIASQTRGIWLVLLALTPCHLLWLTRLTGKQWDLRPVLAVILIILIILTLQIVPSPRNPFYSPESPLLIRFTHFTPSHLATETRLRIAVCSTSLLASRPLLGHGLGSFQYVFPTAQASYFAEHPDTFLSPSPNRTVQAHNDWLQLLIELGLPGLLIVLAGVYVALRRGWNNWLRLRNPSLQLEMTAALMAVAAVMIYAFVDFSFHVVSTGATALFFLAVWASCGPPAGGHSAHSLKPPASGRVARQLASLVVLASIAAAAWFYCRLHASMYESLGTSYRIYYGDHYNEMSSFDRRYVLGKAYDILKRANKLAPLDCQIAFRLGEVATLYGALDILEAEEARAADDPTSKIVETARRRDAVLRLGQAIHWLETCQTEIRYHELFHYLGMAHEYLFRLYGREEDREAAKFNYRLAVRYSPCFSRSLYQLFQVLQRDRPPNVAEMRDVCRQIARYDPAMFQRRFTQPVMKAIERRDFQQAAAKIDVLIDVQPDRPDLWLTKIHLLAYTDKSGEAEALLAEFPKMFPQFPSRLLAGYRAEVAAGGGRYEEAARQLADALAVPGPAGLVPYYRCLRAAALEKLNRPEAKSEWVEIEQLAEADQAYRIVASDIFLFLIRDGDRAYSWLVKCCRPPAGGWRTPAPASLLRIAAEMSLKRGEKEQGVEFLKRALELDSEDLQAQALLKTAKL